MEKALVTNSVISLMANNGVVAVAGSQDVTFIPIGNATFKLQGSPDGVIGYADIAGSNMPTTGSASTAPSTTPPCMSVFRAQNNMGKLSGTPQTWSSTQTGIGFLKVVMDTGTCVCIRRLNRTAPPAVGWGLPTGAQLLIDPQYGTYNATVTE